MSENWRLKAVCLGRDDMFPAEHEAQVLVKRRVCRDCPVKSECLDYALATGQEHGVWGNTTEKERGRMVRLRRQSARERRYRESAGYQAMFG